MDMIEIIANELAKEISERFGFDVEAIGSFHYDLIRPIRRAAQNRGEYNSYVIAPHVAKNFSISVEPDRISITVHKGNPPLIKESTSILSWAEIMAQVITIDNIYRYDINDPKSIDAVLDQIGKIINGQPKSL